MTEAPLIHLVAVCLDCRKRHEYRASPARWIVCMDEWQQKHLGHRIEYVSPRREIPRLMPQWMERIWERFNRGPWWLDFAPNVDIKLAYASSAAYTISLAPAGVGLASSATLVAGREGTAVSNTTNLYVDYAIAGNIRVGTTPTINTLIEVWAYASSADAPTSPDVFDGTDSAETVTSVAIKQACLALVASMGVDATTTDRDYPFRPVSLSSLYGSIVPKNHGLFVTHSSVAALNATGGNHVLSYTGSYFTG